MILRKTKLYKATAQIMQNLLPSHYCFIITTIISQPIKNVIICATVLEEIRHRNIAAYGRVRTLLTNNPSITYTSTDAGGHNNTRDPLLKDSGKNMNALKDSVGILNGF